MYDFMGTYGYAPTSPTVAPLAPVPSMALPPAMPVRGGGATHGVGPAGATGIRIKEPSGLVYHLPLLSVEPGTQDASVAAGDWTTRVRPVLSTLLPSAHQWWDATLRTAVDCYQRRLVGEPSERLRVRSEVEAYRVDWGHLALINERGLSGLLEH